MSKADLRLQCGMPCSKLEVSTAQHGTLSDAGYLHQSRFRDAISEGEIPSDFPVAERAIQVTDFARGLTMRAQIGTPRKTLLRDAEEAADLVLLPRLKAIGKQKL